MASNKKTLTLVKRIEEMIYLIRGQRVMMDSDLAQIYGVSTMRLNEQFKRNAGRFPADFAFQLDLQEFANLKSQIAISSLHDRREIGFHVRETAPPYRFGTRCRN